MDLWISIVAFSTEREPKPVAYEETRSISPAVFDSLMFTITASGLE
jgi:hypothetical protein